ncbi:MAG TPA: nucleotide pyrophosphohydrolase, partial [Firmicutes bacterium]|nr:nucleotide pyrophosphohydrolase [Bacillota bacterium]
MGPGNPADLPARNLELLQGRTPQGPMAVWLRTGHHPVAAWLKEKGSEWQSFDSWYDEAGDFQDLYTRIVERLTAMAPVVYGVPGHPLVGETTVRLLLERAQAGTVQVELMGAQSFLEAVATAVGQDLLGQGVEVVDAHLPAGWMPRGDRPLLVGQLWHRLMPGQLKLRLLDVYPAEHSIAVVQAAGVPAQEKVTWIPLLELDRHEFAGPLTSVWVPALPAGVSPHSLGQKMVRVVETVARLRGEGGCPWDREQTHTSLRPYVIEEA